LGRKKYGVGIVGTGWVSSEYIKAFQDNPQTNVAAICSRSKKRGEEKAREFGLRDVQIYTDYEEMLGSSSLDIVCLCSPNFLHAEQTIQAAKAGKNIVIEKPVALNLKDLKEMRDAVRTAKIKTVVGFVLRWNPLFETIKSMIENDFIGNVFYVEADYQHNIGPWLRGWEWTRRMETGGGTFLVGGCHAMDAIRWFAGRKRFEAEDIVEVSAYSGGHRKGRDLEWDGFSVALVKFRNGALAKVSSNNDCVMPYGFPVSVFGDKGTIKDNRIWSHKFPGQKGWVQVPTILPDSGEVTHHPFQGEVDHFVKCIIEDSNSHCDLESAINTHEACIATRLSSEKGKPIKLPLLK